jgi:hypothetical protein
MLPHKETLFREHPKPDLDAAAPPKAGRYIVGKRFHKERDTEYSKFQAATLACIRPLTSGWQALVEGGLGEDPGMVSLGRKL